ncbi:sugar ABC transporter permease (plasmid) [Deinococcus metallilatus]|uniref:Sorbitol/mannitol transport system permease protein n=2 Tax=Deinococcus metallilatus TaxID=1211322 RepID=A0AAJ5F7Z1_9DEIO|nr:sugar ABC transporter permease [Deinococcus metallilatus]MBB5297356.1 sorbitol/mannitol transport system permease protein [Deinococcus metallilatus]QBY06925.1 sugar ABC transporter permease [Deinococcus metallilatus]TLK32315.1 sugar ABC transporter permease [Deinococcus metallilatus]GMA17061.1 ABC transporter permease [Deinococcus metallilatus]
MTTAPSLATATHAPPAPKRGLRLTPAALIWPALLYLILTTQVPFFMTVYYSFFRYNLVDPTSRPFIGLENYATLLTDPQNLRILLNTLVLAGGTLLLTLLIGGALALLLNRPFAGRALLRTLLISSFLVMPVVTAVIWKNMLLNPVFGFFSWVVTRLGGHPVDWLAQYPMASVIAMITWEWTPFAMLILLTGLQSLPDDQLEAARLDGAGPLQEFQHIVMPHWTQAIQVVVLMETIALLQVYGEIYGSTSGGPGIATTNLPYFIYQKAFAEYNIGLASAAGVITVILTNILAIYLLRMINRSRSSQGG